MKFCFGESSGAVKGFRAGCVCVTGSPFVYCLGTLFFLGGGWYHEASPKYLDLFFK